MPRRWANEIKAAGIGVFCQTNNHEGPLLWVPRIISAKATLLRAAKNWDMPFVGYISPVPRAAIRKAGFL